MHFKRTFTLITITVAAFFIGFILQSYNLYRKSTYAHRWVAHTSAVLSQLEDVQSRVIAMQEAHRNDPNPVVRGFTDEALYSSLDTLSKLMKGDSAGRDEIAALSVLVEQKLAMMKNGGYSKMAFVDSRIAVMVDRLLTQESERLRVVSN